MTNGRFKIEKDIAMPKPLTGHFSGIPWAEMAVGDSFLVSVPEGKSYQYVQSSVIAKLRDQQRYGTAPNMKIKTGKADGGVRVWRVE